MKTLSIPVFNLEGKEVGSVNLDPSVFNVEAKPTLINQVIVTTLANKRQPIANTKDRSVVAGSNRKPWKQKGTGNARAGSVRSPLWRGGGVTFGPTNARNYSMRLPQKMRQAALRMVLSDKLAHDNLIIIDSIDNMPVKTKDWAKKYRAIVPTAKANDSMILTSGADNEIARRVTKNIPKQAYTSAANLGTYESLNAKRLLLTKDAIDVLTAKLARKTDDLTSSEDSSIALAAKKTAAVAKKASQDKK